MKYDITSEGQKIRIYERLKALEWLIKFLIVLVIILAAIVIAGFLIIFGNFANSAVMQTDTLEQLNYIRQEVEASTYESDPAPMEQTVTYQLTPEERDLVERVTASEARSEDLIGMEAVAQTILDRSELWNMTPAEVVQAPGQYADPYPGEISDEIHLAVANVFDGGIRIFREPTTHFYSGSEPSWADKKIDRGSIGCHQFLY